jgi:hypothetical protein
MLMLRVLVVLTAVLATLIFFADPALAAPGGKIVSAAFRSFWGKMFLGAVTLVLLPAIVWMLLTEWRARKRCMQDLKRLSALHPEFDWTLLKERAIECFHKVHQAWRKEDMEQACQWMTGWYWQNQQMAHLDRWAEEGLVNVCRVRKVGAVHPLHVRYQNFDGTPNGSRVVVSISADMEDYLMERDSQRVVEGKKGYTDAEFMWTFAFERGQWVVAMIEEGSLSLAYARLGNEVPETLPQPAGVLAAR